jgi:VIT1/CCC1 family predicted Fe2+/Mn2+ transporter
MAVPAGEFDRRSMTCAALSSGDGTRANTVPSACPAFPPSPPSLPCSDFVKSIVFGGLDGIITTFSIVAAVAGASLAVEVTLMMGFSNLVADGISMGVGDFLSSKAEIDYVRSERKREAWEYDNFKEGEIDEMIKLYEEKGVSADDASVILHTMAKYKDLFVDHMMNLELGQMTPADDENPAMEGLVTFLSFLAFGSVPMFAYLIMWGAGYANRGGMFGVACAVTVVTMFALGAFQAKITRQPIIKTGLLMAFNGSLAAAAAYLIGWGIEQGVGSGQSC